MSARDRARRKEQTPLETLNEAIEQKKTLPRPIARGLAGTQKVLRCRLVALEHLEELPELLSLTAPGSQERKALEGLQGDFISVVSQAEALEAQKSKQSQQVADLAALFFRAQKELGYAKSKLKPEPK
jgi:hypothetical protein